MASITDLICDGMAQQRDGVGTTRTAATPDSKGASWRPATDADRGTDAPVRWRADAGAWRYPSGMQADNLLQFDTKRCEVAAE
ncbi:MAG: hypothetical protein E6R08_00680 [Nevskiaceae bacterium]|nr:MAG: hypothetical protein E6R08_00680 [Nevskiaceae bacterium]